MNSIDRDNYEALLWINALSILAPLSWFVLAAPHTVIHNLHASITWFIPFGIVFIILMEVAFKHIVKILLSEKG